MIQETPQPLFNPAALPLKDSNRHVLGLLHVLWPETTGKTIPGAGTVGFPSRCRPQFIGDSLHQLMMPNQAISQSTSSLSAHILAPYPPGSFAAIDDGSAVLLLNPSGGKNGVVPINDDEDT